MLTTREKFILLNLIPGIGSTKLRQLLDGFGGLDQLWSADASVLRRVPGIGPVLAERIAAGCRNERLLQQELTEAQRHGVRIVTLEDPEYPTPLKTISDPPLTLYMKGSLPADAAAVAVVGSRRASWYGLETAERLGYDLALRGVTVVSGLARGIDGAAHRGALKAGGCTVAVFGCGLSRMYPPEHASLASQILERGAFMSEYPMGMEPLAQHFPRRNRLISGLSLGVIVVEAAQRSGALITADCALEQGREVFAVPGQISAATAQGTNRLLQQGARLVASVEDIMEELHLSAPQPSMIGSEQAQRVLACVDDKQPQDIDAIAQTSGLAMPEVSAVLLQLELQQLIRQLPGKQFVRAS
jgi:DNA processing protein